MNCLYKYIFIYKKEAIQVEENKLQTQQRLSYNPMMTNDSNLTNEPPLGPPPPPSLQQSVIIKFVFMILFSLNININFYFIIIQI